MTEKRSCCCTLQHAIHASGGAYSRACICKSIAGSTGTKLSPRDLPSAAFRQQKLPRVSKEAGQGHAGPPATHLAALMKSGLSSERFFFSVKTYPMMVVGL